MKTLYFSILQWIIIILLIPSNLSAQCPTGGEQHGNMGTGGFVTAIKNFIEWTIRTVAATDPNDIAGPKGYAEKQWVSVKDKMPFTIRYENNAQFATAPAQNVFIHLPVDPKIDINSFRLGTFGFGQYSFNVPDNTTFYTTRLDVRDSLGLFVDVTAGIDIVNNEVFWKLRSIDPATSLPPTDATKGFLPVNDTATTQVADTVQGKGEGYVTFFVSPQTNAATGDTVFATAKIVFDINEEIPTNVWVNTIDAVAPVSKITNHAVTKNTVKLVWAGEDDAKGAGVRDYAVYVSEDNGVFKLFQNKITASTVDFIGTPGSKYCFFTLATDNTGNQEVLKKGCDLIVELNGIDIPLPVTWLYFTGAQQANDALLNWATTSEKNTKEFIIERSLDSRQFTAIGTVTASNEGNQTSNYRYLDAGAMLLETKMLFYRLKQVDKDGKYIYSIVVSILVNKTQSKASINAFPNPFGQQLTLKITTVKPTDQTDKVELYTIEGKLVYQRRLAQRGSTTVLLQNLPELRPGTYILNAVIDKKTVFDQTETGVVIKKISNITVRADNP